MEQDYSFIDEMTNIEKLEYFRDTSKQVMDFFEEVLSQEKSISAPAFLNFRLMTNRLVYIAKFLYENDLICVHRALDIYSTATISVAALSRHVSKDVDSLVVKEKQI